MAIAENVYAGNAMVRRAFFQYGLLLPRNPFATWTRRSAEHRRWHFGLIEPGRYVTKEFEEVTVRWRADGVPEHAWHRGAGGDEHVFSAIQGFLGRGDITGTIHNIYTLRGALITATAHTWSKHINAALYRFGQASDVYVRVAHLAAGSAMPAFRK